MRTPAARRLLTIPCSIGGRRGLHYSLDGRQTESEKEAIRRSIQRSRPFGDPDWTAKKISELGLEWTVRPRGRPRKNEPA